MKILVYLFLLSASIGYSAVVVPPPPKPSLTIGLVTETNSPITLSPLGWASVPVVADVRNNIIFVPAGGCLFAASVVCASQPVLAVTILAQSGHTNTVEWSTDMINWTPSNVGWVSDGLPVRYYIPQPAEPRVYRVQEWNAAPVAMILVSALSGGLFSFSSSGAPLPSATNVVVISPNGADAEVVLDGSLSRDAENDPLQYFWEEGTNVFATSVKTTKRLGLGHHAITLKVSDGLATHAASASLETIKVSASVNILMALVHLAEETNPVPRNTRPLLAALEAAAAAFERGNLTSGINQLRAFQHQVRAQILPFNQTTTNLIQAADEIIHAMTNTGTSPDTVLDLAGYKLFQNSNFKPQVATTSALDLVASASTTKSFSIAASIGCTWAAHTTDSWIKTSGNGSGNGTMSFTVEPNTSSSARTGAVSTDSQTLVVNQGATLGRLQWVRDMTAHNQLEPTYIIADLSDNAVVVGNYNVGDSTNRVDLGGGPIPGSSGIGGFIAKYDSANGLVWGKTITGNGATASVLKVATDRQNNLLVAGFFSSTVNFGGITLTSSNTSPGGANAFVAKYSPSGTLLWAKSFSSIGIVSAKGIAVDANNDVFVAATFNHVSDFGGISLINVGFSYDVALIKLSGINGATVWAKGFGGTGADAPNSLTVDSSGNVIVMGVMGAAINFGGGLIGGSGVFLAKYTGANGSYLWARSMAANAMNGLTTDPTTGNIFVTGGFTGSVDFGRGPITTPENGGIFLAAYAPNGTNLWTEALGGNGDVGYAVAMDQSGHLAIATKNSYGIDFLNNGFYLNGNVLINYTVSGNAEPTFQWSQRIQIDHASGVAFDSIGHVLLTGPFGNVTTDFGGISMSAIGLMDGFVAQYTK